MHAISIRIVLGAALVLAAGCGKQKPGVVPVKSPIQTFEKPEQEDVFPEPDEDAAPATFEEDGE